MLSGEASTEDPRCPSGRGGIPVPRNADTSLAARGEMTDLLVAWSGGDRQALDSLFPLAFENLRRIAWRRFGRIACKDLQPTELIGRIYPMLLRQKKLSWQSRVQFYGFAAALMDRVLLDHKRRLRARKRGGDVRQVSLSDVDPVELPGTAALVIDVAEKVAELGELDPRQAEIVRLRYFLGLTIVQIAEMLDVSVGFVNRSWLNARRFLRLELDGYSSR